MTAERDMMAVQGGMRAGRRAAEQQGRGLGTEPLVHEASVLHAA